MEEADSVADRVAIIDQGKITVIGTVAELKAKTGKNNASLEDAFIHFTGNRLDTVTKVISEIFAVPEKQSTGWVN